MGQLVYEDLNSFVRNQDPKKSLGLGYEGKIRNLFREYNIDDKYYEVKENGEIIFNNDIDQFNNKNITKLPNNLTVNGNLDLRNTHMTKLPDNLTIKGYLDIGSSNITELPNNLTVTSNLYLRYTNITKLPNNLKVGYSILVDEINIELINYIHHSQFKNQIYIFPF